MENVHGNKHVFVLMFNIYMKAQNMYVFMYFLHLVQVPTLTPQYIIMVQDPL